MNETTEGMTETGPGIETDDAPALVVLAETRRCALAWEADARLLGNVRAGDIARAIDEVTAYILNSDDGQKKFEEAMGALQRRKI